MIPPLLAVFPRVASVIFEKFVDCTRGQPARVVIEEAVIMASYRKNPASRVTTGGPINSGRVNYNQRFRASGALIYEDKMSELIYKMVDPYRRRAGTGDDRYVIVVDDDDDGGK